MTFAKYPSLAKFKDTVPKSAVADWPQMSDEAATAFKRFTGLKFPHSRLVRQGDGPIFAISDSELAECVYTHNRSFP